MRLNLNRVKAERIAAGISQQSMADKLGISRTSYWKRERGIVPMGADELGRIAELIGIDKKDMYIFFDFSVPIRQRNAI